MYRMLQHFSDMLVHIPTKLSFVGTSHLCVRETKWSSVVVEDSSVAIEGTFVATKGVGLMSIVPENEYKIVGTIKGFSIPAGLPWHLINEVYVPVNCNGEFHWVLAVVVLKERCIK
ncbi:hypothetical protein H5410_061544, partial [Solanum commersonii]